jgi:hypothetical protein
MGKQGFDSPRLHHFISEGLTPKEREKSPLLFPLSLSRVVFIRVCRITPKNLTPEVNSEPAPSWVCGIFSKLLMTVLDAFMAIPSLAFPVPAAPIWNHRHAVPATDRPCQESLPEPDLGSWKRHPILFDLYIATLSPALPL